MISFIHSFIHKFFHNQISSWSIYYTNIQVKVPTQHGLSKQAEPRKPIRSKATAPGYISLYFSSLCLELLKYQEVWHPRVGLFFLLRYDSLPNFSKSGSEAISDSTFILLCVLTSRRKEIGLARIWAPSCDAWFLLQPWIQKAFM
jgi:hypothetical protein